MNELKSKYDGTKTWRMRKEIENDMRKIELSKHKGADDWWVNQAYGKTVSEMWKTLSLEEKEQAENTAYCSCDHNSPCGAGRILPLGAGPGAGRTSRSSAEHQLGKYPRQCGSRNSCTQR
jgi:hypothetical protein